MIPILCSIEHLRKSISMQKQNIIGVLCLVEYSSSSQSNFYGCKVDNWEWIFYSKIQGQLAS